MDLGFQTYSLHDGSYDDDVPPAVDHYKANDLWKVDYTSISRDRRSFSEVSSMSRMASSSNSITSESIAAGSSLVPYAEDNTAATSKPKRRRENRYKNAPPAVISRRRAQNRASQRAYRERKDQRIRDLEQLLDEAQQKEATLSQAYHCLKEEYDRLLAEGDQQSATGGSDVSLYPDPGFLNAPDLSGVPGTGGGFDIMDGFGSTDMMAGLYLQHDPTTYPPVS